MSPAFRRLDVRAIARNFSSAAWRSSRIPALSASARDRLPYFRHVVLRNLAPAHRIARGRLRRVPQNPGIVALIRVRNEELLLADSLDHLGGFADAIIVFDDASTDSSVEIALRHPKVNRVIVNRRWRSTNRIWEETANRRALYRSARRLRPQWVFYADADERFVGDIRSTLLSPQFADVEAVRIELFDAYMTASDHEPYAPPRPLLDFREYFGVERRRILMAWRPSDEVDYRLPDSREPQGIRGRIEIAFQCQHYGKALSIEQWDETCRYYIENFPPLYQERWRARLGKAIHTRSDFDTELHRWSEVSQHAHDI